MIAINQNHILFIDGNYFSTTFEKLDNIPPKDDNVVFASHNYWNITDISNNGISYSDIECMRVRSDDSQNNGNNGWSFKK